MLTEIYIDALLVDEGCRIKFGRPGMLTKQTIKLPV
jgi:hypothetical protein